MNCHAKHENLVNPRFFYQTDLLIKHMDLLSVNPLKILAPSPTFFWGDWKREGVNNPKMLQNLVD